MFFYNLRLALRSIWRDKFYAFLNVTGLAVGLAASLLIFLWANDEISFDNFHQQKDRIYRVLSNNKFAGNDEVLAATPFPLVEAAKAELSEVEKMVWMAALWEYRLKYKEKDFQLKNAHFVDRSFFEVFDFPFAEGNAQMAFSNPNSIVLTADKAMQIFGSTEAIGQSIEISDLGTYVVSAVLDNIPSNSHLKFSYLIPYEKSIQRYQEEVYSSWEAFNTISYVLLKPNVDKAAFEKKLTALAKPHRKDKETAGSFQLQPLTSIHLGSAMLKNGEAGYGSLANIKLILAIGFLILLIACINYVNLSTARSAYRLKTNGIRKIMGADRWNLFTQYIIEASVLVALASLLGACLAIGGLGLFENLSGKVFNSAQLFSLNTSLILGGAALLTLLLSGIYPAFQFSTFLPIEAVKQGQLSLTSKHSYFRNVLVSSQFICSGVLIICTLVMFLQMKYVKEKKLGYEREHIFSFPLTDSDALVLKNELQGQPGITEVTASGHSIVNLETRFSNFEYEGKPENLDTYLVPLNAEEGFSDFFGLNLKEGRWFRPGNSDGTSFLLNETAVDKLGLSDPIGKRMKFIGEEGVIVGVVENFHFKSLHEGIDQMIIYQQPKNMWNIFVKTTNTQAATAIASARAVFNRHEPAAAFDYQFLDQQYDNLYKSETRSSRLLSIFAALAILISCLGVLGLSAYAAEKRQKEIGIRKILGASLGSIMFTLSKDLMKLVLLSFIIAAPIAWYFMRDWLNNFAFSIDMPYWGFLLAGLILTSIAFVTVIIQTTSAVLRNPVEALQAEE